MWKQVEQSIPKGWPTQEAQKALQIYSHHKMIVSYMAYE